MIDAERTFRPIEPDQKKERQGARWISVLVATVFFILLTYGVFSGTGPRRYENVRRFAPEEGPGSVDCVWIVASSGSRVASGAVLELVSAGFSPEIVSVHYSELDPGNHKRGCYNAHVAVHRKAVAAGCNVTLVAEEDVVIDGGADLASVWSAVDAAAGKYDTLWLGYVAVRLDPWDVPGLVTLQKPMLAHGILFSRDASAQIAALPPWNPVPNSSILEAYDVILWHRGLTNRTLGLYPPVAGQLSSRAESFSLDKRPLFDWIKSVKGVKAMARASYMKCSFFIGAASTVARALSYIVSVPPDTLSITGEYSCE